MVEQYRIVAGIKMLRENIKDFTITPEEYVVNIYLAMRDAQEEEDQHIPH